MKGSPRKGHDERVNPKGHPAFSINENQSFNSTLKLNTLSYTLLSTGHKSLELDDSYTGHFGVPPETRTKHLGISLETRPGKNRNRGLLNLWVRMDPTHLRFFALEDGFLVAFHG